MIVAVDFDAVVVLYRDLWQSQLESDDCGLMQVRCSVCLVCAVSAAALLRHRRQTCCMHHTKVTVSD